MGSGATLVDGVRRWFQRRSSTTSSSLPSNNNNKRNNNNNKSKYNSNIDHGNDSHVSLTDLRAESSTVQRRETKPGEEEESSILEEEQQDFDVSGLKILQVPLRTHFKPGSMDTQKKGGLETEFFTEYGEANRYQIQEVIGKGSYGVVGSAIDSHTGERVAIKKINDVFEHVSDATRILREIKLLRLLRHPDIVEIKHIMLPPSRREFRDIYVVFELMESDLHQVIKANDDLTPEHYQFFLYQLLRGLKYIHTANVFHRDLKPKNILANADCKLKICDFGLARVSFNDAPSAIFWTDYVATRWYRAPELCGSFFSKYTPAIDIWSIGCIFAEMLTGKPLFPGKNVVHQLDLMTDLLGTPPSESIARIRNEKARRYLSSMRKKQPVPFAQKFPNADPLALRLLERLLAFDPKDRPTAEEALSDPYFNGLANVDREPSTQPISKLEFEFERRKLTKDDVRELIYREILEYHPQMLQEYLRGGDQTSFMYPSGVDRFKRQFAHLEEHYGKGEKNTPLQRQHASLPRERVTAPKDETDNQNNDFERRTAASVATTLESPPKSQQDGSDNVSTGAQNGPNKPNYSARSLLKSASISASKCIGVKPRQDLEEETIPEVNEEAIDGIAQKVAALHA
ncbi:mitogen-activated protein kinase 9 [Ziziphus jujuba]|uniref:Mitogen-activated protein kinase 9 n=1 Tax=Ziziphus jujuba TaxID=326968 RepID=A0A6P4BPD8_ZIZJJ|nr:mitogen-activated protein kinase 9 [Ziziphus jujuba]